MSDGSAVECVGTYHGPDVEVEAGRKTVLRWNTIPWTRIIIDTLLVAGILLASSSFLSVR